MEEIRIHCFVEQKCNNHSKTKTETISTYARRVLYETKNFVTQFQIQIFDNHKAGKQVNK